MEPTEASEQLSMARRAQNAADRTPVPAWAAPLVGCGVFAGFAALALLPLGIWGRLAAVVVALGCWGACGWLVLRDRAREGIHGAQGALRTTIATLLACAVTMGLVSLHANASFTRILLGLGVVAGVAMGWLAVRRERSGG